MSRNRSKRRPPNVEAREAPKPGIRARFWRWYDDHPESHQRLLVPVLVLLLGTVFTVTTSLPKTIWTWLRSDKPQLQDPIPGIVPGAPGFLEIDLQFPRDIVFDAADGNSVTIVILFNNRGFTPVKFTGATERMYILHQFLPAKASQQVQASFAEELKSMKIENQDIPPGENVWRSQNSRALNIQEVLSGSARLYVVARANWVRDGKPDSVEKCVYMVPPASSKVTPKDIVWHLC